MLHRKLNVHREKKKTFYIFTCSILHYAPKLNQVYNYNTLEEILRENHFNNYIYPRDDAQAIKQRSLLRWLFLVFIISATQWKTTFELYIDDKDLKLMIYKII